MERWQQSLDKYLTTPPEDDYDDVVAGECVQCGETFYHMDEVYFDSRLGHHFCDKECFKKWLLREIDTEIDEYIDILEDNKDTYDTTIEAEFDDEY